MDTTIPAQEADSPGWIRLQSGLAQRAAGQNVEDYVAKNLCLTLQDGHVEGGMVREDIENRF